MGSVIGNEERVLKSFRRLVNEYDRSWRRGITRALNLGALASMGLGMWGLFVSFVEPPFISRSRHWVFTLVGVIGVVLISATFYLAMHYVSIRKAGEENDGE